MYRSIAVLCNLENKPWLPGAERAISVRVAHGAERGSWRTRIPSLGVSYEHITCSPVIGERSRGGDEFVGVCSEGRVRHHRCHSLLDIPPDVGVTMGLLWLFLPQEHVLLTVLSQQKRAIYSYCRGVQRRCRVEEQ